MSTKQSDELRKVQVTGGSTFIVSLPKTWIEQTGLRRGSVVRITQNDNYTLMLSPEDSDIIEPQIRVIINPTPNETPESVVRRVVSSYLMGYNVIQLKGTHGRLNSLQRISVKNFTRRKLIGTETLVDLPQELTLQVLVNYSDLSIKDALRRMSVIAVSMHREAITALSSEDLILAKEIVDMDDEVDRFNLYIIRLLRVAIVNSNILKEAGLKSRTECLGYRLITKSVERMADHAVKIAHNKLELTLSTLDLELQQEFKKLSDFALKIFEDAMEAVFCESYQQADQVLGRARQTRAMEAGIIKMIVKHAQPEEAPALRLILESIIRSAEYGEDIAEAVLNIAIKDVIVESSTI